MVYFEITKVPNYQELGKEFWKYAYTGNNGEIICWVQGRTLRITPNVIELITKCTNSGYNMKVSEHDNKMEDVDKILFVNEKVDTSKGLKSWFKVLFKVLNNSVVQRCTSVEGKDKGFKKIL